MDELMEALLDTQVSLGFEAIPGDKPAWVIRSILGDRYHCAFRTPPRISIEDFVSWYIFPAAVAVRESREALYKGERRKSGE